MDKTYYLLAMNADGGVFYINKHRKLLRAPMMASSGGIRINDKLQPIYSLPPEAEFHSPYGVYKMLIECNHEHEHLFFRIQTNQS